jgi:hypothetical protein
MRALASQATQLAVAYAEEDVPVKTASAAGCPVGALERKVLDTVNGHATIGDITRALDLTPVEVAQVIRRLTELGAIVIHSAAAVDDAWDRPAPAPSIPPTTLRIDE